MMAALMERYAEICAKGVMQSRLGFIMFEVGGVLVNTAVLC